MTALGAGEYVGLGVRVMAPESRWIPGEGRNPGDSPIGVPDAEKKFVRLGVVGGAGVDGFEIFLNVRFLGE